METLVVSHDNPLTLLTLLKKIRSKSLCGASEILEGVIVRNDSAPAVCAKFYCVSH